MKRVSNVLMLCDLLGASLVFACSILVSSLQAQTAAPQGSWSTKAPLPLKVNEVAVATVNGKIYVIGGTTADVVDLRLNQQYDPATDRWRERAPLPRGL